MVLVNLLVLHALMPFFFGFLIFRLFMELGGGAYCHYLQPAVKAGKVLRNSLAGVKTRRAVCFLVSDACHHLFDNVEHCVVTVDQHCTVVNLRSRNDWHECEHVEAHADTQAHTGTHTISVVSSPNKCAPTILPPSSRYTSLTNPGRGVTQYLLLIQPTVK